jgi:hypothetical protein
MADGLVVQAPQAPLIPQRRWRPLPILLLDTSASMEAGSPRRIDLTPQSRWRVAVFSHVCRWVDLEKVPEPYGNTNLAGAFMEIGKVHPTTITLVGDGQPDDPQAAHTEGLRLRCPIHILFVGDPHDAQAIEFCRTLAKATHGTFATKVLTLASLSTVTATVRKMLGAGAPASIPLGGAAS